MTGVQHRHKKEQIGFARVKALRSKIALICVLLFTLSYVHGQSITIDRQVNMLALGDSYTIGQSVETWERWPHQFIDALRNLGIEADYPDYIATTGWTTLRLIQGIRSMLDEEKNYNLVSILIGVNNQYQRIDIASYEPDLITIIDRALEIAGQDTSRVFILSIPDYAYTPFGEGRSSISEEIDAYNLIKKNLAADYGIPFIDITPISRLGLGNPSLVALDGLHPSGEQYGEWVKEILPRLELPLSLSGESKISLAEGIKVFPNPAQSYLTLESDRVLDRLLILNALGQQVHQQSMPGSQLQIDVSQWPAGFYTIMAYVEGAEHPYIQKLLVKGLRD
jgi:lysophospholipase L1-like esterase